MLPYEYNSIKLCGEYTNLEKLNGHRICEALSLPIRVRILQELIKAYPNRLTISRLRAHGECPGAPLRKHLLSELSRVADQKFQIHFEAYEASEKP